MYKIKSTPEDFIVKEVSNLEIESGPYSYFLLTKKNYTTPKAIELIAMKLNIHTSDIGYAGNKDKIAVTEQFISIKNISPKKVEDLKINDVSLKFVGNGKNRINLGDLNSNDFKIVVRDISEEYEIVKFIENYFDDQRFGKDKNNYLIGKYLIKKNFKEACSLLGLEPKNNDFVGCLRKVPIKKLRFYISSYQSYLFNEFLKSHLTDYYEVPYSLGELYFTNKKEKDFKVPILGFLTDDSLLKQYQDILKKENISKEDFVIRPYPELSSEGDLREAFVPVRNIKSEFNDDSQVLEFNLPKGSYATIVVKKMFGQPL